MEGIKITKKTGYNVWSLPVPYDLTEPSELNNCGGFL